MSRSNVPVAGNPGGTPSVADMLARARAQATARQDQLLADPYVYRRSIVTFIDILGFREMVRNRPAGEIGRILAVLGDVAEGDVSGDEHPAGLARSIGFSDSIVRACPIDSADQLGALFYELISLVHVQMELASLGVFMRGGLTVGDVYMRAGKIFGPAMVRAYDLESKYAIYPRVIVDPLVVREYFTEPAMQGHAHDLEHDMTYLQGVLRVGDDQLPFVDYLRAMRSELDDPTSYRSQLLAHRTHIVSAATALNTFNNAKQKYFWLAGYHNSVVESEIAEDAQEPLMLNTGELGELTAG
jgi:hypothetical protein